jgi:hypothetical protein
MATPSVFRSRHGASRWGLSSTLWPWFAPAAEPADEADPQPVRAAMRACLHDARGPHALRVLRSVGVARDLRSLWYLRSGLLQALAAERGELHARHVLAEIDVLFREAWPAAPVSPAAGTR